MEPTTATLTTGGKINLPHAVRELLGIKEGEQIVFYESDLLSGKTLAVTTAKVLAEKLKIEDDLGHHTIHRRSR